MRYWYVSSFVLMALVLQVFLLVEARAEEELGLTNAKTLNTAPTPSPSSRAGEAFAQAGADPGEAADGGLGTAASVETAAAEEAPARDSAGDAAEDAAVAGASADNPVARFDLLSFVTGNESDKRDDEPQETKAEPDYSRWRSLYQSIEELPEEQKRKASAIVGDSLPRLNELDTKISGTVGELQALTYSDNADPEELPRLGLDLQRLREELKATLAAVNIRLQKEAGLRISEPAGRGCESMRIYPAGAIKAANLPQ